MENKHIPDVEGIIKRAKEALHLKTDSDLAAFLGVSRATVSNWSSRNRIDFHLLLQKMSGYDLNWLLVGKGRPSTDHEYVEDPLAPGEVQMLHHPKTPEPLSGRSIPLYELSAAANLNTIFSDKHQNLLGHIRIPNIPSCDGALSVTGDSMYPLLKSGDIVGYREVKSLDHILYGEIYLIGFTSDGDDYLTVKYINRADEPGHIRLVSYNPHHAPQDIPLSDVRALAIVKFSIRRHLMM